MYTQDFLAAMKARLLKDKERLEHDLADVAVKDPKQPGHYIAEYPESKGDSEDDNASEVTDYADELSLVGRLESELRDTVKAIENIDKGTYGVCKYCNKQIDIKRLEARPTSSACIDCKKSLTQEL